MRLYDKEFSLLTVKIAEAVIQFHANEMVSFIQHLTEMVLVY